MADKASRETSNSTDYLQRRPSFRRSLAEAAEGLPAEFLDQLEQKRKQLDDSIHKYIASKEREYKLFEKDLRLQHRTQGGQTDDGSARRRTPAEDATAQQHIGRDKVASSVSAVDTLLRKGLRRDSDSIAVDESERADVGVSLADRSVAAGLVDRRASLDRDKEFVGVFTPQYLPMLESGNEASPPPSHQIQRTTSAPSAVEAAVVNKELAVEETLHRSHSDTVVQATQTHPKRPAHLQLSQRTSSSGSSVEGRLISAMKSPTADPMRPKRKRVSLAVGDVIVAPSDNVPNALSNNSTPSHSRTPSFASDRSAAIAPTSSGISALARQPITLATDRVKPDGLSGSAVGGLQALHQQETAAAQRRSQPSTSKHPGDDVGEFWHMEEPDSLEVESPPDLDLDPEFEEDIGSGIGGRVGRAAPSIPPTNFSADEEPYIEDDDPLEGSDLETEHIEFHPSSVDASKQPTLPGFRRPSVAKDPEYMGRDYTRAAENAEATGVYGSSAARPTSKGSFTGGSLGESYMARHAEEMMRLRAAQARS